MSNQRIENLLSKMKENDIPQMIISDTPAIFYLTGKWMDTGERLLALYLNVNGDHRIFINELFPVTEDLGMEKVWFSDTDDGVELISQYIDKDKTMGIDKNWEAKFLLRLMELEGGKNFVNGSLLVDQVRMQKDEKEQDLMREASRVNDIAVQKMIDMLPEEITEKELADRLMDIYKDMGGSGFSFDPIIAYGANAADPHCVPGDNMLKAGDSVVIDIGCIKDYYHSDMTRTVFYKEAPEESKKVFNIVLEANKKAIEMVKPGIRFCDIDAAARDHIEAAGYGEYFIHRTGHSIGIEGHEYGDVSSANTDVLKPGMIFSVEPGIYIPGQIGVRVEDLVIVTEDGYENLNKHNKELTIVG